MTFNLYESEFAEFKNYQSFKTRHPANPLILKILVKTKKKASLFQEKPLYNTFIKVFY